MSHIVVSLYDYTGEAVRPWADAGYQCHCYDIQHPVEGRVERLAGGGSITFHHADLHRWRTLSLIAEAFKHDTVAFMFAFPVCTDLAVSGAAHFAAKAKINPRFQDEAATYAEWCGTLGLMLGCPFMVENPVSVLATKWRKPDHKFQPYQYGGYIPADQGDHPIWPEYIAPFDGYPKKTCLWTGGGFVMPKPRPVPVPIGYSTQHKKLGGKSAKTKNIRSATPRGFALAVFAQHGTNLTKPLLISA